MFLRSLVLLLLLIAPVGAEPIVGHYPGADPYWGLPNSDQVRDVIEPTGVRLGFVGDFTDIEYPTTLGALPQRMDAAWYAGSVYVLNLMTTTKLQPLAYPASAADWTRSNHYFKLARVIKTWGDACGPTCYLLVIPYPEMNKGWVPYGEQPRDFIEAFGKLRYVLQITGALPYVRMVWGPMVSDYAEMARYAPHPAWVEYGGCSAYTELSHVEVCVKNLRAIYPGKPILLTQTGACGPWNATWGRDLVMYLKAQPDVLGFLWFDYNKECDWRLGDGWRYTVEPLDPRGSH